MPFLIPEDDPKLSEQIFRTGPRVRSRNIEEDWEKITKNFRTFSNRMLENPYIRIPTFFGVPFQEVPEDLDLALIGVPFDLGMTNRSGARMGPRELRN